MSEINISKEFHLSPPNHDDIPRLIEYCNDPLIYQNTLSIPFPYYEKDAITFLKWITDKQIEYDRETGFAIRNSEKDLMGVIGLVCKYGKISHKEEVGYWLAKPYRGKGITAKALGAYVNFLFEKQNYTRAEAITYHFNIPSQKVLETAGFECEGLLKKYVLKNGNYIDCKIYAKCI